MKKSQIGALAISLIAGAWSLPSVAQSPSQLVQQAQEEADRQADITASLDNLQNENTKPLTQADARDAAAGITAAARMFAPVPLNAAANWQDAGLNLRKATVEGDKLVQTLSDGSKVTFTVDPDVQKDLERMLDNYNVPHAGVVLIEPSTGKVKAFVSHNEQEPAIEAISRKATAPSASVFKIITAAALIESAGINPLDNVCYHGGRSRLTARNIKGDKNRDRKCANLGSALAWSINSIIAKLTYKNLSKPDLEVWAERFGYNSDIPFELPVETSTAEFVNDDMERARSAAGFWHTYLSPLHGAMIGASLANDGVMMAPSLIEKHVAADGTVLQTFEPKVFRRVMSPNTAKVLSKLMVKTTTKGTARKYFRNRRGFPNHIEVTGKTGTLSNKKPYLGFTWFVGFATDPKLGGEKVAVSGLVCNTPKWRIKGPFAASEAVRMYFKDLESSAVASR